MSKGPLSGMIFLTLALAFALVPSVTAAEGSRTYAFPGGVVLEVKSDEMTDKRVCTLFSPMQGAQVAVSGDNRVAIWTSDQINVSHTPLPMMRVGEAVPFELAVPDRPHLMLIPPARAAAVLNALYGGEKIRLRFSDWPSGDPKNFEFTAGVSWDFGGGYDRARVLCGWGPLQVKRLPMSKEPHIYQAEKGYIMATFAGVWTVIFMPEFESCAISVNAVPTVFSSKGGHPDKVLPLGTIEFRNADGDTVASIKHEGYEITPIDDILASAEKAGEYGTVLMSRRPQPHSLFGFREAVDYAEHTCGIQIRKPSGG